MKTTIYILAIILILNIIQSIYRNANDTILIMDVINLMIGIIFAIFIVLAGLIEIINFINKLF
jgi:hypothetical protein